MPGIEDTNAAGTREPQPSVRGLGDLRYVSTSIGTGPDAIGTVEDGRRDDPVPILSHVGRGRPCVEVGPTSAHETAGHVQPRRSDIVLDGPVHRIARQPVLAGERGDAAVL